MNEQNKIACPECESPEGLDRREFIMAAGGTVVALAALEAVPQLILAQGTTAQPAAQPARVAKPAEALIRELYQGLSAEQRGRVVYPWNHGATATALPTRKRMYNAAIFSAHNIGAVYTPAQRELNQRIFRAIGSGDEGYRQLSRANTFDASQSFERCGAYIFGDPTGDNQFAWVFTGHHLTVRCDGNSEPNAGFGGPMYYGHTPDGMSARNVFNYQTRSAIAVWDALSEAQRRTATIQMYPQPREQEGSVRFRAQGQAYPGISIRDLTADQRRLLDQVMRDLLSPYRREDGDEVMELVRRNGGVERLHLGFYKEAGTAAGSWDFWRIEGPGFVWNFRVLPHVHCFVNIGLQAPARG